MRRSQKFLEQRKFLMVAPILVLPFLTATFWALGGGSGTPAETQQEALHGLNLDLPPAHFSEEQFDKFSLYETARKDSMKFKEARDNDPYFKFDNITMPDGKENLGAQMHEADPNETLVNSKLAELYRVLNKKPDPSASLSKGFDLPAQGLGSRSGREGNNTYTNAGQSDDVKELNAMMEMMQSKRKAEVDPEETRINTMLDKILDIQHPERVRDKLKEKSYQKKGQVFPVVSATGDDAGNLFYSMEDNAESDTVGANAIEAVIHHTQELVAGATVKMRLLSDVYIDGRHIPKDQFVFGIAGINGERLTIAIASIRYDNSLFPVSLDAYDLDGLEGIYVPGAITRDAAKQSSDQAMQSMQFMSMDQSLGAQAGAAGIQAAKGLFSKKVKLIKVTVKAGYRILLRDSNAQ